MPESKGKCGQVVKTFHNYDNKVRVCELTIDGVTGTCAEKTKYGVERRDSNGQTVKKDPLWYETVPAGPDLYPVPAYGTLNSPCPDAEAKKKRLLSQKCN